MTSFSNALEYVHGALRDFEARGVTLAASVESLAALSALAASDIQPPGQVDSAPLQEPGGPAPRPEAVARVAATAVSLAASPIPALPVLPSIPAAPALPILPPVEALAAASIGKAAQLAALRGPVLECVKCEHLARSRTQVVFGVGNPEAELMFVGEAPGEDEDRQGEPFVGRAGQLLTKIIEAMGFPREQVYIANVLKCRPDMPPGASGNRKPTSPEMQTCLPYLQRQIEIVQPRVIVALGATAMEGLLGEIQPMARLRGRWHDFHGTPLMATYHPAYLVRNQSLSEKRKVWEDMLLVLERLGKDITGKQRQYFLQKA